MWVDKSGRAHSLALEDPGTMLDRALRNRIELEGKATRKRVLESLNDLLSAHFEADVPNVAGKNEKRYKNALPPPECQLMNDSYNPDLSDVIIQQIKSMPMRWRIDVLFAALQYLYLPDKERAMFARLPRIASSRRGYR